MAVTYPSGKEGPSFLLGWKGSNDRPKIPLQDIICKLVVGGGRKTEPSVRQSM